jgi:CII-binding regulator of phage lambda lysogenization HflD
MNGADEGRVIALAGLFQGAALVERIAREGEVVESAFEASL